MKRKFKLTFIVLLAVLTAVACVMFVGCRHDNGNGGNGGNGNIGGSGDIGGNGDIGGGEKEEVFVDYVLKGFVYSVTGQEDYYIDIDDMSETDHTAYDAVILMYGKHIEISESKLRFKDGTAFLAFGEMNYVMVGDNVSVSEPTVSLAFNYIKLSNGIFTLGIRQQVGAFVVTYGFEYYSRTAVSPSYTVTFDSVGGSDIEDVSVKRGEMFPEPRYPEREGYTFEGWYKDKDYTNVWDFDTDRVLKDTVLYAKWNANRNIVTFVTHNDKGESWLSYVYSGYKVNTPRNPQKTGYDFVCWCSDEDLTQEWDFSATVTQSISLYAKYAPKTYTVYFNAMGGTCDTEFKSVKYKEAVGELPTPTREGFEFGGWCEQYNFFDPYTEETLYSSAENRTLYAKWMTKITLDTDGLGTVYKTEISAIYSVAQYLVELLPDPVCDDADFVGWYTESGGNGEEYSTYSYPKSGGITLYAAWRLNVVYDEAGGRDVKDATVIRGKCLNLPTTSRTGYTFDGWYDEDGNIVRDTTKIYKNSVFTLTARWTANEIVFRFDPQGGICAEKSKIYVYDSPLGELPVPEKNGNVFGGWFTSKAGAGNRYEEDSICKVSYSITLYAKWSAEVTFEYEGATSGNETTKLDFVYNSAVNVSLPEPYKTGWSFEGWFTQIDGGGTQLKNNGIVSPDSDVWSFEGNTNMYAYWVKGTDKRSLTYTVGTVSEITGLSDVGLTELEIPAIIDLKPVRKIKTNAFKDMRLTKVVVPSSVTQIEVGAFRGCPLTEMTLPFIGKSSVAEAYEGTFGYIFGFVMKTTTNSVEGAIRQYVEPYQSKYYWYYIPTTLKKVTVTNVNTVPGSAFRNCRMLDEVVLADGTVTLNEYAFGGCTNLTSVSGLETVTRVGQYAFYDCTQLTTFPTLPLVGVGSYAFYNCTLLTEISFGDGLGSVGDCAFYNTKLTSVTVPNSVEYIGVSSFFGCPLEELSVPFIGKRVQTVYEYDNVLGAIFGMKSTEGSTDDFSGMTYQMSGWYYYIPSTLKRVTVTGSNPLPDSAFNNCTMLEEINLIGGPTELKSYSLSGCRNLKKVRFGSAIPQNSFYVISALNTSVTIVVPDEYIEDWKDKFPSYTIISESEEITYNRTEE